MSHSRCFRKRFNNFNFSLLDTRLSSQFQSQNFTSARYRVNSGATVFRSPHTPLCSLSVRSNCHGCFDQFGSPRLTSISRTALSATPAQILAFDMIICHRQKTIAHQRGGVESLNYPFRDAHTCVNTTDFVTQHPYSSLTEPHTTDRAPSPLFHLRN
jgi:hypothetical protein